MRDKIKDIKYFDDFINKLKESQERRLKKIENNQIKPDRISSVKKDISKNYIRKIFKRR